jgi:predicted kinase
MVRAKVAALRASAAEMPEEERAAARREASRYVQLAAAYELEPAMILMCGLPASGKSWAAQHVAPFLDPAVLSSDVRRKRLAGIPLATRHKGDYEGGLYAPELKQRTYESLLAGALAALGEGRTVVVDATFSTRAFRAPFLAAAERAGFPLFLVHVTAPERVIRERMERRARDPHEASDATFQVYLAARERFEPPEEIDPERVVEFEAVDAAPEELGALLAERRVAAAGG